MKVIAVVAAGRIARRRHGYTFICRHAGARELADDPAIVNLIVERDGITSAGGFANASEAAP